MERIKKNHEAPSYLPMSQQPQSENSAPLQELSALSSRRHLSLESAGERRPDAERQSLCMRSDFDAFRGQDAD